MLTDRTLSIAAGEFGVQHPFFAKGCEFLTTTYSVKTLPFVVLLVFLWAQPGRNRHRAVLSAVAGCFLALAAARLLQHFGPFRPRPHSLFPDLFPWHISTGTDWNSFPSDTASAVMALTAGIFIASRPLGIMAALWAVLAVAVP